MQGILFKSEMTLANLNGLKSRTSRTRGLHKINENPDEWTYSGEQYGLHIFDSAEERIAIRCPYGKVGSELYGKETYQYLDSKHIFYKAGKEDQIFKWRSPMMMPEWASRYHIILEKIIAQRIQEISEDDCKKEGCRLSAWYQPTKNEKDDINYSGGLYPCYKNGFANLWDSINGKTYPWSKNCWVWGLYYRVVRKEVK